MSFTKDFVNLPLGVLVSQPIIEVAKGQAELCNVYLDNLFRLAFKSMPKKDDDAAVEARVVKFKLNRQVVDPKSGNYKMMPIEVEAPLLSLVPVPAFTMEEATVRFSMEVHENVAVTTTDIEEGGFSASYNNWGVTAEISGKTSTQRENTRSTDKQAKYEIFARAAQQPPAEGMAKLTTLFASVIDPIKTDSK